MQDVNGHVHRPFFFITEKAQIDKAQKKKVTAVSSLVLGL